MMYLRSLRLGHYHYLRPLFIIGLRTEISSHYLFIFKSKLFAMIYYVLFAFCTPTVHYPFPLLLHKVVVGNRYLLKYRNNLDFES